MRTHTEITLGVTLGIGLFFSQIASATVYTINDNWTDWNNEAQYYSGLGDENGTPKVKEMRATVENGFLTAVEVVLHTSTTYQKYNSLFINTSWDGNNNTFDQWDFLVHDGGTRNAYATEGNVASDGIHRVDTIFDYTMTKNYSYIRGGNPNGIDADFLDLIDNSIGATRSGYILSYDFTTSALLNNYQGLDVSGGFFLAYSPWCANDVIGGGATMEPVPEPATMLLFGTGLVGLASTVRRKRNKTK